MFAAQGIDQTQPFTAAVVPLVGLLHEPQVNRRRLVRSRLDLGDQAIDDVSPDVEREIRVHMPFLLMGYESCVSCEHNTLVGIRRYMSKELQWRICYVIACVHFASYLRVGGPFSYFFAGERNQSLDDGLSKSSWLVRQLRTFYSRKICAVTDCASVYVVEFMHPFSYGHRIAVYDMEAADFAHDAQSAGIYSLLPFAKIVKSGSVSAPRQTATGQLQTLEVLKNHHIERPVRLS